MHRGKHRPAQMMSGLFTQQSLKIIETITIEILEIKTFNLNS